MPAADLRGLHAAAARHTRRGRGAGLHLPRSGEKQKQGFIIQDSGIEGKILKILQRSLVHFEQASLGCNVHLFHHKKYLTLAKYLIAKNISGCEHDPGGDDRGHP